MDWSARLDRLYRPFEGTRDAAPVAVFRIAFFAGLALHFFPSLMWLDDSYRSGALRTNEWNDWLYAHFWRIGHADLRIWSYVAMAACVMGIVGAPYPRVSAALAGAGFYAFASFNGLHLQTLALIDTWAILMLFVICGGGTRVLSLEALLRKPTGPAVEPRLLSSLVVYQVLLAVFFSGIEKVVAGWPRTDEMAVVLAYPGGFLVRDWVAASPWLRSGVITHGLSWMTVLVELGTPLGILFRRTRPVALAIYQVFFLGIVAMLEIPPLFYCIFAFGGLLALDDDELARARAFGRRAWSRLRPSSSRAA